MVPSFLELPQSFYSYVLQVLNDLPFSVLSTSLTRYRIVYGVALTATAEGRLWSNLDILNLGNEPTFCSSGRLEVIDITLGSFGLLESITGWEVSSEPSLSDHGYILFTLQGSILVRLVRNPRATNWGSYKGDLRDRLERGPEMDMNNEAGLGLAIHSVQQALISAYEDNCLLDLSRQAGNL